MQPSCCPCVCRPFSTLVKNQDTASGSRFPESTWGGGTVSTQGPWGPTAFLQQRSRPRGEGSRGEAAVLLAASSPHPARSAPLCLPRVPA